MHYARFGINTVEDLVSALALETDGARRLASGAPVITDDENRIATSNVYEKSRGMSGDDSGRLFAGLDPLQRADSFIYTRIGEQMSFPYLARRSGLFILLDYSIGDRIARMAKILGNNASGEYLRAHYFRVTRQVSRSLELLRLAIDEHPEDDSLRTEFLRGWITPLANDQAPNDVAELARGLSPLQANVLQAVRHAVRNEWREVALADEQLARVGWTEAWYPEALELRVNWRIRVLNPADKKRYADEAIVLLDRLCIMNPTLGLFGLRTRAGVAAERPEIVIESLSNYSRLGLNMVRGGLQSADSLRIDAKALLQILDATAGQYSVDQARVAEVRAEISRLMQ